MQKLKMKDHHHGIGKPMSFYFVLVMPHYNEQEETLVNQLCSLC